VIPLNDLVEGLVTGLVIAIILIPIVWWFWKRFDRPSDELIEYQEAKAKQKEEAQMWAQIEQDMRNQEQAAKQAAANALAKIEARKRAESIKSVDVANAWSSLGMSEVEVSKNEVQTKKQESTDKQAKGASTLDDSGIEPELNVDDLLATGPLTKVRSDAPEIETGKADAVIEYNTQEPDWELIQKLKEIADGEATIPEGAEDLPEAPNLELLEYERKSRIQTDDTLAESGNEAEPEVQSQGEEVEQDEQNEPVSSTEKEETDQVSMEAIADEPNDEIKTSEEGDDPFSSVESEWSEENSKAEEEDEWGVPW